MSVKAGALSGKFVRLEPMAIEHVDALASVGLDFELWRWQLEPVVSRVDMEGYVRAALDDRERGVAFPFVVVDQSTNAIIGTTRYADIVTEHRRLEIGWTWLALSFQRTQANTEAKYLLLHHAFEMLEVVRVCLKTDALNEQSRRAIERLGAKQDGILRNHMITSNGRVRDTVYFSIIDREWPAIKCDLERKLGHRNN